MDKRWEEIKNKVLGKNFNLSVVFADSTLIRKLNRRYRKKNKTTTVLSFPLSKTSGEIFLNSSLVKKADLDYLFIHSVLHLKGYKHGKKMEKEEKRILEKFYGKKHYNWN